MKLQNVAQYLLVLAVVFSSAVFNVYGQFWQWGTGGIYTNESTGIGTMAPLDALHIEGHHTNGHKALRLSCITGSCTSVSQMAIAPIDGGFSTFAKKGDLVIRTIGTNGQTHPEECNGDIIITALSRGGSIRFGTYTNEPADDTEKMTVLNNGNVGIGVSDPKQKLVVDGTICAHEVRVALSSTVCGWPDYVFEENYQLPTLEEVEQHIQTNGHLPGIPSAAQVENEGVHIGEMQARLLEKIEQLTLYMIDLKKENDALKASITGLQQSTQKSTN